MKKQQIWSMMDAHGNGNAVKQGLLREVYE